MGKREQVGRQTLARRSAASTSGLGTRTPTRGVHWPARAPSPYVVDGGATVALPWFDSEGRSSPPALSLPTGPEHPPWLAFLGTRLLAGRPGRPGPPLLGDQAVLRDLCFGAQAAAQCRSWDGTQWARSGVPLALVAARVAEIQDVSRIPSLLTAGPSADPEAAEATLVTSGFSSLSSSPRPPWQVLTHPVAHPRNRLGPCTCGSAGVATVCGGSALAWLAAEPPTGLAEDPLWNKSPPHTGATLDLHRQAPPKRNDDRPRDTLGSLCIAGSPRS
ncbi:hypothetical protein VTK73DRAFT_10124 [Phialemonium thermophilum]|uniref:Uncharacterized protein n=1 Tax=Phialemonium thermophilum TaxID=223376 RepID=A0ABR3VYG9_9PEZI